MATKRKNARKVTWTRYDSADYLKTPTDVANYLQIGFEEDGDDPAFIAHMLGIVARSKGMAELAEKTGLTREGLYRSLSADGNPSLDTLMKVLKALGLKLAIKAA
jgi:probable addiction module antidote protein